MASIISMLEGVLLAVRSLQTEIVIFFIAICFHRVFFGRYQITKGKLVQRKTPSPSPVPESPKQGSSKSVHVQAAERICKAGGTIANVTEKVRSELKAVRRADLQQVCVQVLEGLGRNATVEFVAAVRTLVRETHHHLCVALGEQLLRIYLGLRLKEEFDTILGEVEDTHGVADEAKPGLALLALKGALKWGDLEAAMSRLEKVRHLWSKDATPSAAPHALMQQLVRLAAQKSQLRELVKKLRSLDLMPEAMDILLAECSQRGEIDFLRELEQFGRTQAIEFTDATYSSLLTVASDVKEAHDIFQEAVSKGTVGNQLLQAASEWAYAHGDLMLADAVVKKLPAAPSAEVAAGVLRFYAPGGPGAKQNADQEVLNLYSQHFSAAHLPPAGERMVAEAALRSGRKDVLKQLLSSMRDNAPLVSLMKSFGADMRIKDALAIFWACPEKTTCLYNAAVDVCVECECHSAAQEVMDAATRAGLADIITYNTIIKAHLQGGNLRHARMAVKDMRNAGLQPNCVTFNELLDATIKVNPSDIWNIIDEMRASKIKPNHITCSILLKSITAQSKAANVEQVLSLLDELEEGMDEVLLSSMVEACVRTGRSDLLVAQLKKQRTSKRVQVKGPHTYGSIIRAYGFVQDIAGVWDTWKEMRTRHILPTSVTLGCMVEALVTNGDVEAGYELICEMNQDDQCAPLVNAIIYCSVLKGFSQTKRFDRVWSVYQEMLARKVQFSIVTFNTLVDACSRNGEMERISGLLKDMVSQGIQVNIITYSAILKGYCQGNRLDEAFQLVDDMKKNAKLKPDEIMYNTLLDGCARKGLYDRGILLLEEMQESGIKPTNFTLSVLVKLASRSKRLADAFKLCEDISSKFNFRLNVHVYSNLIHACTSNRDFRRALDVLEKMVKEKIRPDTRTYSLLLRAAVYEGAAQDAAGLIRAAMGLHGAHPRLASCDPRTVRPHGGLPTNLLSEILEDMVCQSRDSKIAVALLQDLRTHANIHFDQKLQLRLTSRALSAK